jgi:biopolymer transport protein ExbB
MFPFPVPLTMPVVPPLLAAVESQSLQQVWKFFADGGFFMILLAACSLVGVAVILFKLFSLRREIVVPAGLAAQVDGFEARMKQANGEALLREFEAGQSTLARLCAVASRNRGKSQAEINEAVQAAAREEIVHLHAGMTALVVVFGGLGDSANHTAIALGIGRALNTTIVGLAISVPAVVAQGWFQRRIDTMAARLEVLLTRLAHALESAPRPGVAVPPPITPHA